MLPSSWRPLGVQGLIRVGPHEDGGYVIPAAFLKNTQVLIGLGLSTDWRFEEEFKEKSRCKVVCYDHTVNGAFWGRKLILDLAEFTAGKWSKAGELKKYIQYKKFFRGPDVVHHQRMISYDGDNRISIKGILETFTTEKVFLKIDIEGWEYRVIDDLERASDNVIGFVIEFHDVDLHRDRISGFIERLSSFRPVHLHANNIAGVDASGDPLILEVTFARSSLIELTGETCRDYPISDLDFPNDPSKPDIVPKFG